MTEWAKALVWGDDRDAVH